MPLARSTCYSASSCERARLIIPRGNAGRYPNGISWVAIVIAPIIGIAIFWLVHILPEKIAEKKKLYKYATYETILKRDGVVAFRQSGEKRFISVVDSSTTG